MVKKVTNRKSLQKILTDEIDSLFNDEAHEIVELLEEKGYIEVEQTKYNIIVPPTFENKTYKDIYSKKIGFVQFTESRINKAEYVFTQEEIDNNPVLKKLEALKVEVK